MEIGDVEQELVGGCDAEGEAGPQQQAGSGEADGGQKIDFGENPRDFGDASAEGETRREQAVGFALGEDEAHDVETVLYHLQGNGVRLVQGVEEPINLTHEGRKALRVRCLAHKHIARRLHDRGIHFGGRRYDRIQLLLMNRGKRELTQMNFLNSSTLDICRILFTSPCQFAL